MNYELLTPDTVQQSFLRNSQPSHHRMLKKGKSRISEPRITSKTQLSQGSAKIFSRN